MKRWLFLLVASIALCAAGTGYADVYTFKDGSEKKARLRDYDPPLMRLEYADDTGVDFPVTTHIAFVYDVEKTAHPQKFVSEDYRRANIFFEKGNTFFFKKDYRNAILQYDDALSVNPEHIYAQLNRGSALLLLGEYDEAIGAYRALRQQEPSLGVPLAYIAYAYFRKEMYFEARDLCAQALSYADVQADVSISAALGRMRKVSDAKLFPR